MSDAGSPFDDGDRGAVRPVERFLEERAGVARRRFEVGELGFVLFEVEELAEAQIGYAVGADDEDLTGEEPGRWQPLWLVVGEEELSQETLLVDLAGDALPVLVAAEDEEGWAPREIASSIAELAALLAELEVAAQEGAAPPAQLAKARERTPDAGHAQWRSWLERAR